LFLNHSFKGLAWVETNKFLRIKPLAKTTKGNKGRQTSLSKTVLKYFLKYFKEYNPSNYLFEGQSKDKYSSSSVLQIVKRAVKNAQIIKTVTSHMLRHSFAKHLLEGGTDIRFIQTILGRNSIKTTEIYAYVATNQIKLLKIH
jgi:site-specific recombinase XerD